jgi:rubredoxin
MLHQLSRGAVDPYLRGAFMEKFECGMCEYTYDPSKGDPGRGIPPGTAFEDLPHNWTCPKCNAGKNMFTEA